MRNLAIASCILALGLLVSPRSTEAQVHIGPTLAYHNDFDVGVGGTLNVEMPALGERIGFMAEGLVFFPSADNVSYLEFNGNLTYDFPLDDERVRPFFLLGLNVGRLSVDVPGGIDSEANAEIGLNLGGGLGFELGAVNPIIGGRVEIGGGEGFVLFLTLPFDVSGN